jgi:hypothetical protein
MDMVAKPVLMPCPKEAFTLLSDLTGGWFILANRTQGQVLLG